MSEITEERREKMRGLTTEIVKACSVMSDASEELRGLSPRQAIVATCFNSPFQGQLDDARGRFEYGEAALVKAVRIAVKAGATASYLNGLFDGSAKLEMGQYEGYLYIGHKSAVIEK